LAALDAQLARCGARLEDWLDRRLPGASIQPARLHEAMRYAVLGGGKRLRAGLVYLTGEAFGADPAALDAPAAAVELIHAYSLIHDDLPCMDDDALRRGKPSCHVAFGEAVAMLAGDSLQSLAFDVLGHCGHPQAAAMTATLARAAGSLGMAGGQALDLDAVGRSLTLAELRQIHTLKTGALISAAVQLGAQVAELDRVDWLDALGRYAAALGLGFQIRDDILDVEGDTELLGKQSGADAALDKPTYPSLLGLEAARKSAADAHAEAVSALEQLPATADPLRAVADFVINRLY